MRKKIKKIIDDWDPMGLFPDAPEDEYVVEIAAVYKLVKNTQDEEELAAGISKIFNDYFAGLFRHSHEECIEIAQRILVK